MQKLQKVWAVLMTALMTGVIVQYCRLAYFGETKPNLATWLLFEVGVVLSLVMYLNGEKKSLWSNAANLVDVINVSGVVLFLIFFGREVRLGFTSFEWGCFFFAGLIFIGWLKSGKNEVAHLMVQIIMVVAYFPLFKQLWGASELTESFSVWLVMWLGTIMALLTALSNKERDWLALAYNMRAFLCVGTVLVMMTAIVLT